MNKSLKPIKAQVMAHYLDSCNFLKLIKAKVKGRKVVYSYYARVNNFGDQFNSDLVNFYDAELIYTSSYKKSQIALVGSILGSYLKDYKGIVAGSGFLKKNHSKTPNSWNVKMIRGPLSASQCGVTNVFYADPGIIASIVYQKQLIGIHKNFELGILPHSRDVDFVRSLNLPENVKVIYPRRKPLDVAQDIFSCRYIASSSLHGLIFADSFQIPNIHIKFGNRLAGDLHKFNDYYLGMDGEPRHIIYQKKMEVDYIISQCKVIFKKEYLQNKIFNTHSILEKVFNEIAE